MYLQLNNVSSAFLVDYGKVKKENTFNTLYKIRCQKMSKKHRGKSKKNSKGNLFKNNIGFLLKISITAEL